jgi:hypothetical protein
MFYNIYRKGGLEVCRFQKWMLNIGNISLSEIKRAPKRVLGTGVNYRIHV